MIKTFTIETGQKLTEEQLAEISEAKKYPIVFDDDCPAQGIPELSSDVIGEIARKYENLQKGRKRSSGPL